MAVWGGTGLDDGKLQTTIQRRMSALDQKPSRSPPEVRNHSRVSKHCNPSKTPCVLVAAEKAQSAMEPAARLSELNPY